MTNSLERLDGMSHILKKVFSVNPATNFAIAIIYSIVYDYVYRSHIVAVWEYSAFRQYHAVSRYDYLLYILMASIPFIFYKGLNQLASSFTLFVYVFVYIPFIYSLTVYGFPDSIKYSYQIVFFIIIIIYFRTDSISLYEKYFERKKKIPFSVIPRITVILFLILITLNVSQLHFVNFFVDPKSMYEFRESSDIKLIYVLCWLRAAFLPLLMLYYLKKNDYLKYGYCFIGFLLLFMLDQQKMTIVFPFAITAIFYSIKYYGSDFGAKFHIFLLGIFIIIPILLIQFQDNPIALVFCLIFIYRIQCIAGMQFERYMDFFEMQDHPNTYYTHINIINEITGLYPYKDPIGIAINADDSNSNATFFLMDGVAAAGIIGCVIIGMIFLLLKSMLNSLGRVYNVPLLTALFLFPLQSLMNVSLFTSFFTHGILVLFLILLFVDINELK